MCGITGWVSFERDLRTERATVEAMTATMALRGPDAGGVWIGRHAAIGHRRLAVIDVEGGVQPMVAETAGGPVVLTYSGETYNFTELRDELRARGRRFRTRSDTEVVLAGYLEWGEAVAERLNGMYAFAVWDGRDDRLVLVRDRLGVKPLYHSVTRDGVLFGSEPKAILANPLVERVVDADGLREALSWIRTPGHAVWRDLAEVRPGTVVTCDRRGLRERRYWCLDAVPHTDDLSTTVANVRSLLEDVVRRQLVSDVPRCLLLSGGLDSSLVTALAQRELGGRERVRSFAVDFRTHTEDAFVRDEFRDAPDGPFARLVADHVGTRHENVLLDAEMMADPAVRRAVVAAKDLPAGFGDADNSLLLLFGEIRRQSTVALSGESADEVFGGYRWLHQREAQRVDGFPWVGFTHVTSPLTGTAVFSPGLLETLDVPGYVRQRYTEAVGEVPRLPGEDAFEARMRLVCHLHLTRYLRILLDRKDRLSMAVGLEVRVPFCDHRLVGYVYNTPWAMKTFDGREKSLLRAAARDLLPAAVLERRKAPYPATRDPLYQAALVRRAREVAASASPVLDLTDRAWLDATLRLEPAAVSPDARVGLERWLDMAAWLEVDRPRLDLD